MQFHHVPRRSLAFVEFARGPLNTAFPHGMHAAKAVTSSFFGLRPQDRPLVVIIVSVGRKELSSWDGAEGNDSSWDIQMTRCGDDFGQLFVYANYPEAMLIGCSSSSPIPLDAAATAAPTPVASGRL
ncbi:unnamed protein product [Angiostrongylus costaricensis]|uniref:Transket_pyr domain-containing protein n=1 Tax=Angiostrongylus costaricensis TaxID=334426 RepID=A0A158PJ96_ANGCS|nr:unnamed protein product [Angiostrongylus costaricensis]